MTQPLTSDQINQLESLGIDVKKESRPVKGDVEQSKTEGLKPKKLTFENRNLKSKVFPLLSISGLTILSFSGLLLLKSKTNNSTLQNSYENQNLPSDISVTPTQVPKSIQHYLLTSQQYFSQALQSQKDQTSTIDLLNNSILAATSAIKEFPQDYRGYLQRAQIYQSLVDSKPEFLSQAISDLNTSYKLNSNSSEITHLLASLYAKKGDIQNTLAFLNQTIIIEPTKAQNFYDLAKIQQQAGLLPQALQTYNQLLTLVSDSTQKTQITSEKLALEKLVAQNPSQSNVATTPTTSPSTNVDTTPNLDSPLIQALADSSLIVAAPEIENKVEISNQTESNSLAGNSTLSSGQKQIVITNTNISSTSQVYVTITKGGKNQNLQVLSKSNKSFTVGLDSPINEDIEFKWWIIN